MTSAPGLHSGSTGSDCRVWGLELTDVGFAVYGFRVWVPVIGFRVKSLPNLPGRFMGVCRIIRGPGRWGFGERRRSFLA